MAQHATLHILGGDELVDLTDHLVYMSFSKTGAY
jgi:hypothetical protein